MTSFSLFSILEGALAFVLRLSDGDCTQRHCNDRSIFAVAVSSFRCVGIVAALWCGALYCSAPLLTLASMIVWLDLRSLDWIK